MNKYIKIKGHDNWFLELKKGTKVDDALTSTMQKRLFRKIVSGLHNMSKGQPLGVTERILYNATNQLNYQSTVDKHTILIRPIGSYMIKLKGERAIKTMYSKDFPIDNFAEIVICENDKNANSDWIKYLEKRFPNKIIKTITFFDTQDDSRIREYFKHAKYITFSTTFTSLEWWDKLVRNLYKKNIVIGYCGNDNKWKEAMKKHPHIRVKRKKKI